MGAVGKSAQSIILKTVYRVLILLRDCIILVYQRELYKAVYKSCSTICINQPDVLLNRRLFANIISYIRLCNRMLANICIQFKSAMQVKTPNFSLFIFHVK